MKLSKMLHFDTFCWENLTRDKLNTEVVFQSFTEVSKLIESDHKKLFLEGIFWKIGERYDFKWYLRNVFGWW